MDISAPERPTVLGSTHVTAPRGIEVVGEIAYVVSNTGLLAIDVGEPSAPQVIGRLESAKGNAIAAENGYLYLSRGTELTVVDAIDPTNLRVVDSFSKLSGQTYNLSVQDGLVYVASEDGGLYVLRHTPDRPTPTPASTPTKDPTSDDRCRGATVISDNAPVADQLAGAEALLEYRFKVEQAFSQVTVTLTDVTDQAEVLLFHECVGSAGPGSGRPIGPGRGRPIGPGSGRPIGGGKRQLSFNALARTGTYFIRVRPRPEATAFPISYELKVNVAPPSADGIHSLILTDVGRVAAATGASPDEMDAWTDALSALAEHPSVRGLLIPNVASAGPGGTNIDVQIAYEEWDDQPSQIATANRVAQALHDWLWSTQQLLPDLRYVIIAADDQVVPHYRMRLSPRGGTEPGWRNEGDYREALGGSGITWSSPIGRAIVGNRTLTDDFYAAPMALHVDDAGSEIATSGFFLPQLSIGRLVETPSDMLPAIQAFLSSGGLVPIDSALVAGHDFMTDGLREGAEILRVQGLDDRRRNEHIGDRLSVSSFRNSLFSLPHGLVYLGFHSTHELHELPDKSVISAEDIQAISDEAGGSVAFALACHGGLNVPGPNHPAALDFPQAWLERGVSYIGSSGWAYGGEFTVDYQEALFSRFMEALLSGDGMALGDALLVAKRGYYEDLGFAEFPLSALHAKTLAGTVLYGLPMARISVANPQTVGLEPDESDPAVYATPPLPPQRIGANSAVRRNARFVFRDSAFQAIDVADGRYYAFATDGVWSDAGLPVQPKHLQTVREVTIDGRAHLAPRSVLFIDGTYHDVDSDPVISQAGILGQVSIDQEEPPFNAPGWVPPIPVVVHRFEPDPGVNPVSLAQAEARIQFYLGQVHGETHTQRLFESMTLDITFSDSVDRDVPELEELWGTVAGDAVHLVAVPQHDESGTARMLATCTKNAGTWTSYEFERRGAGVVWETEVPAGSRCIVQVLDGAGNVGVDTANGVYHLVDTLPQAPALPGDEESKRVFLPIALREECRSTRRDVDVALVLDLSTSMLESSASGRVKIDAAAEAAAAFVAQMRLVTDGPADSMGDRVAIVGFNSVGIVESPLTRRRNVADRALRNLRSRIGPGTRLDLGLRLGSNLLTRYNATQGQLKVMIVLTDGRPSGTSTEAVMKTAEEAHAAGVRIYAIGMGQSADLELLARVASAPEMVFDDADLDALSRIYTEISAMIGCSPVDYWGQR
jgi:Mg-chelatase subunit ChlD